ncbi:MAG: TlpA family protein disulfide reductase [Eggerthellaceae bacterium]|nr:TlpA family protein disulfide reductase [Eggerthellaceae bacterium]
MIEPVEQDELQNAELHEGAPSDAPEPKGQRKSAIIAVVVLVIVVVLALVAYGALRSSQPAASSESASQYIVSGESSNASADDVDAQRVLALEIVTFDGQDTTLGQVADGKPIVVNMWATWCPYCVAEMQDYQALYDKYGDDVRFVMLNACDSSREVSLAREYIAENGFTFPVYYDADHQVMYEFGVRAYPTTIILSDTGRVLMNRPGQITYDSMDATLASLTGH